VVIPFEEDEIRGLSTDTYV